MCFSKSPKTELLLAGEKCALDAFAQNGFERARL